MKIVAERPRDRVAVLDVTRAAFGGDDEAHLVEALDRDGDILASFVALDDHNHVIGHILFSPLKVVLEGKAIRATALAPVAVYPDAQRQGVGTMLVNAGIEAMRQIGQEAIIVLGHEEFYPRFGFRHDLVANLACPFNTYNAFMGFELAAGSLAGKQGNCRYAPAFGLPES